MKEVHDLSKLPWTLAGYTPYLWQLNQKAAQTSAEVRQVAARVPGSLQQTLLDHGIVKDWLLGNHSRDMEWIENRHWVYETTLPAQMTEGGGCVRLLCDGLDGPGWVYINGEQRFAFANSHIDFSFDLTGLLNAEDNRIAIVFDLPPRWNGQFGYSSKMQVWKTRYNYTWDWVVRLVQLGIIGRITLEVSDGDRLDGAGIAPDYDLAADSGMLTLYGDVAGGAGDAVRVTVWDEGDVLAKQTFTRAQYSAHPTITGIKAELWWPNGMGGQPLYRVDIDLLDEAGKVLDSATRRVGFRHIEWQSCAGAPKEADPWLCVVNGRPVFLQGVNFQPIRANYADIPDDDYEKRVALYRELGANMFRINACGYLESELFYDLCDRHGILVWQEFPITSSGVENLPPDSLEAIQTMGEIAESFIRRRRHHPSLCIWCGANELCSRETVDGRAVQVPSPPETRVFRRMGEVCAALDPTRRYVTVSPAGPRECAIPEEFGKGLNWDVHGPYAGFATDGEQAAYYDKDDALFRSELCCAGANPIDIMQTYCEGQPLWPADKTNPYWCRPVDWWVDIELLSKRHGRSPESLEEYVAWSQAYQADTLAYAMGVAKRRFPAIGGVLLWGSHDTFPQPANTTIIDFWGRPKPAALALARVWRDEE